MAKKRLSFAVRFLYRKTNLNWKQIYRTFKRLNIKVKISREENVNRIIAGCELDENEIISKSEIIAIDKYVERQRTDGYDSKHFLIGDKRLYQKRN